MNHNPSHQDLAGQVFGFLTALKYCKSGSGRSMWICKCACGSERAYHACHLKGGKSRSCGCQKGAAITATKSTHGMTDSRTYVIWRQMKSRCHNQKSSMYPIYGGRGISICDRWLDFSKFLEDMGEAPDGLQIDRINNDGNYEPGNCRWSTVTEQANNRRSNVWTLYGGKRLTISQLARAVGWPPYKVGRYLRRGAMPGAELA